MKEHVPAFGHITDSETLRQFLQSAIGTYDGPILLKPNWANALPQSEPHCKAVLSILDCLDDHAVSVIESYSAWRNKEYRDHFLRTDSMYWKEKVTPENGKDMWKWLRDQDEWFLRFFTFASYFSHHDISYINCTEEVWNGRVTPVAHIQSALGERFDLVKNKALLETIPQSVWRLRGSLLINVTRMYDTGIYAAKNLMGLIPEPNRTGYHGDNDTLLVQNIHDINIIYRSLFRVIDIVESLQKYRVIISGSNPAQLDEIGCVVLETELQDPYHDIPLARNLFGLYPPISLSHIPSFIQEAIKGHACAVL
jgi:hypothetical protein